MIVPVLVGLAAGVSTTIGGLVALRVSDRRHLVLGAAGGVILGVVAFDLLPEAFEASHLTLWGVPVVMLLFVAGFLTIHVVEKSVELHHGEDAHYAEHRHPHGHGHDMRSMGLLAGSALVVHSFLDGVGIGVAFSAGIAVAVAVSIAVLAHDFADGFNTFTVTALYGNSRRRALTLVAADALAPAAGAFVGSLVSIGPETVALYLAYFAGFLLHIATGTILPEAHADHPSWGTLLATVCGVVFMGVVVGGVRMAG